MLVKDRIEKIQRDIDWSLVSDDDLRFAYHLLNPHAHAFGIILDDIVAEMSARVANGGFTLSNDEPCKVIVRDVPEWLKRWPFVLLLKQREARHEN